GDEAADSGRDIGKRHENPRLDPRHVTLGGEIIDEVDEEENQNRVAAELRNRGTENLANGEQLGDLFPAERRLGCRALETAAGNDQVQLLLIGELAVLGFLINQEPDAAKDDADDARDDEQS